MFGGPQGSYLKYLTRISVTVSGQTIVGIDFEYGAESAPVERLQAGRNAMGGDDSLRIPFTIDGPGGEILTGIQVNGDCWKNITSIKVSYIYPREGFFFFFCPIVPQNPFLRSPLH